jgi:hypothetical protein
MAKFGVIERLQSLYASARASLELEPGEFGVRAVPKGAWGSRQRSYCLEHGIHELHFNYAKGYKSDGCYAFLSDVDMLEGLKFIDPQLTDLSFVEQLQDLRALHVSVFGKLKRGADLRCLPRLERFTTMDWIPGMESLFECTGLKRLGLSKFRGTLTSAALARLTGLEELWLAGVPLAELVAFSRLKQLEALTISGDKALASISGLEGAFKLKSLTLEYCPNFHSLAPLASLSNLEKLWLYDCGDIDSLTYLEHCTRLTEITIIGNTRIVDGALGVIERLPALATVCIVPHEHYAPSAQSLAKG